MIGRNTRRAISLALACATLFAASGALAQRPAGPIIRVAPQPQTQPPPQTNPQLQMSGTPQLYTVDTIKLEARVKQLEQRLIQQHDQIATQQQQISTLILQLGNTQNTLTSLDNRFTGHKHKLQGVSLRMFQNVTCTYPGGYPSCQQAAFPNQYASALSLQGAGSGSTTFDTTTGPVQ
jgi:TolA-binding protein